VVFRARRFVTWLFNPLFRLLLRHIVVDDPWRPVTSLFITPERFGPGSFRMFPWYFEGESRVQVRSVNDVCHWLTRCQYLSDEKLFNESDFWQHPLTFEHLRKGDCEDHALWAWRKLVELGYPAELFVGQWFEAGGDEDALHAWVVFVQNEQQFLLEPVIKHHSRMVRPLDDARADYAPHFSVDSTFTMRSHEGYLLYLKDREAHRRQRAA